MIVLEDVSLSVVPVRDGRGSWLNQGQGMGQQQTSSWVWVSAPLLSFSTPNPPLPPRLLSEWTRKRQNTLLLSPHRNACVCMYVEWGTLAGIVYTPATLRSTGTHPEPHHHLVAAGGNGSARRPSARGKPVSYSTPLSGYPLPLPSLPAPSLCRGLPSMHLSAATAFLGTHVLPFAWRGPAPGWTGSREPWIHPAPHPPSPPSPRAGPASL